MFKVICDHCKKDFYYRLYNETDACSWPCFTAIFEPLAAARRKQKRDNFERGIVEKRSRKKKNEVKDVDTILINESISEELY